MRKTGLTTKTVAQEPGDEALAEERKDFNQEGQKETGFASSVVPTLEEKMVIEQRPPKEQIDDDTDHSTVQEGARSDKFNDEDKSSRTSSSLAGEKSAEPRTDDNVLFGAPANAKTGPDVDNEPPARSPKNEYDEEETAAPSARSKIRSTLGNKSGVKHPWTVPTTKPKVEPHDFEDPISEAFWKNIWVASAVHNVSNSFSLIPLLGKTYLTDLVLP